MANRPSNRDRNAWTVDLMHLEPHHRVLELGCGPGLALRRCLERVREGRVVGVDHSEAMIVQAARRLRGFLADGRLGLICADESALPLLEAGFDRIFAVNVIQFIAERRALFQSIRHRLTPGGMVAMTYQPRNKNPTRADALRMADAVAADMAAAGLVAPCTAELPLTPVPAVCVMAQRPAES
jgi:cyclopropane fatty-acyl-phospholipid synthase-like methyltransferase